MTRGRKPKLTREQALAIRAAYQSDATNTYRTLAASYGTNYSTIGNVVKGLHCAVRAEPDLSRPGPMDGGAARKLAATPSGWQAGGHRKLLVTKDLYEQAYAVVDRKVAGDRRKEIRKWIFSRRNPAQLEGLIKRLESLPDIEVSS